MQGVLEDQKALIGDRQKSAAMMSEKLVQAMETTKSLVPKELTLTIVNGDVTVKGNEVLKGVQWSCEVVWNRLIMSLSTLFLLHFCQVLLVLFQHSFYDMEWTLFHVQAFDV